MLTIAVLGALLITGEYSTGMIRSTFASVPTRIPVLAAKALSLVVLTAAVTLLSVTLSYFVTIHYPSQHDLVPALDDPGTWRVLGGTLYPLTAAAPFSLGIGTLLRSTAASITAALTVLLLLPGILSFITLDWVQTIVSYLPLPASSALLTTGAADDTGAYISTHASLLVMAAYALVPNVRVVRTAGVIYLCFVVIGVLGFLVVRPQDVVAGDRAATLTAVRSAELLAGVRVALELGIVLAQALAALWLFRLFHSVSSVMASAVLAFDMVNAVMILVSAAMLTTIAPPRWSDPSGPKRRPSSVRPPP